MKKKGKASREKKYDVTLDVFFTVHKYVTAKNREEAIEEAKNQTRYGEGEEVTVFEVNLIK